MNIFHGKVGGLFLAVLTVCTIGAFNSNAQTITTVNNTNTQNSLLAKKKIKPIRTELSVGIRLNTDGWSVFADKGWVKGAGRKRDLFYDVNVFQVELGEHKHVKEIKRTNNLGTFTSEAAKPFIFGKLNNFYNLKLGYGKRKMLAGKPVLGAVAIHWVYLGGITVGFLKPYYIEAYVDKDQTGVFTQEAIKYEESTKEVFLSRPNIIGSAGFSKGIGETKIVPGAHAKTALHFDFAGTRKMKLAIETGINAEIYTSSIPLMANQKEVPYFVNMYVALQFGKRWP
ncbi:MAG: hypothetical protein R2800_00365 [Flavipsychrobacter sp.]